MNKVIFFLLLIGVYGLYIFNIDHTLQDKFSFINSFKKFYVEQVVSVENTIDKYFTQVSTIEKLKIENDELKKFKILYTKSNSELNNILENSSALKIDNPELKLTKVLSYTNFDNFTKVWLDVDKKDKKIEALISNNYAAGIVINKADKSLALLNGNEKSNYAVYVGGNKAPGIIHASSIKNHLLIKYIPIWIDIKVEDEVVTSGMDNIFFEGLKVGKVVAIKKMADMQEAEVIPYAKVLEQSYFYTYKDKIKP